MTIGSLAFMESSLYPTRNTPIDTIGRSSSAIQAASARESKSAPQKLAPLKAETAQNARIYSTSRLRISEHTFDNAPLTKSAAHLRARAKVAMSNIPASAPKASPQPIPMIATQTKAASSAQTGDASRARGSEALTPHTGCTACESRVYQDGSDDSGVSFQSPKGMPASMSGVMVAAHEGEHVTRETARAFEEGSAVTQKKVTMQVAFCQECNRMYYAGGTTTISTTEGGRTASPQNRLSVRNAADSLQNLGNAVDLFI